MDTLSQKSLGQIVADDFRTADIFRSYGLDFCCGGKKSLDESCAEKKIKVEAVLEELNELNKSNAENNYNEWGLDFLVDYIVNNHHKYIRTKLPEINFYAEKVARVHGDHHPELLEVFDKVKLLNDELLHHIEEEEEGVFNEIKDLVRRNKKGTVKDAIIEALEDDHEKAGELMETIEKLTDGFNPPEDACASYRVYFQNLEAFQIDLHKHVHLENNILFPKALSLEASLN